MVKFIDRNSVITYIKEGTERRGIVRAIDEGRVEYLGGFSQTSFNTKSPIWICKITSEFDRTWVIAIYTNGASTHLRNVPWSYWVGDKSTNPLYTGDRPEKYRELRRVHRIRYPLNFEQHRKQRSAQDWTGHTREDNSPADKAPLDPTNTMPVLTRLGMGIKNFWKRFF